MKYTIELTPEELEVFKAVRQFIYDKTDMLNHENSNFERALVIPLQDTEAYKQGLEDGNKIADKDLKEIQESTYDVAYNKGVEDFEELFMYEDDYEQFFEDTYGSKDPDYNLYDLVAKYGAKKVVNDFNKWQEEKKKVEEEIKVGDEVTVTDSDALVGYTFIVMQIIEKRVVGIRDDWHLYENLNLEYLEKTGRHFDEVEQLLNKLRGEDNE